MSLLSEDFELEIQSNNRVRTAYSFFEEYSFTEKILLRYLDEYLADSEDLLKDFDAHHFALYLTKQYYSTPGIRLGVPLEFQIPDMRYGCELASMSMLLQYASDAECTKYTIWEDYRELFPEEYNPYREGPLMRNTFFPCHLIPVFGDYGLTPVNLCGKTFEDVLRYMVFSEHPVILWSAYSYETLWGHVFVLTGYDPEADRIYYNDPRFGIRYRSVTYLRDITYFMGERDFLECQKLGSEIDPSYVESVDSYLYAISYA